MRQVGQRSHCDNNASMVRDVTACVKASDGHFEHRYSLQVLLSSFWCFWPHKQLCANIHVLNFVRFDVAMWAKAAFTPWATCINVDGHMLPGNKLLVRDTCWLYLGDIITIGRLVSLCIQQQTGNKLAAILLPTQKHVDGDRTHVALLPTTSCRATCCPGVNAA